MDFSSIFGMIGSAATGGITGLIGTLAGGVLGYFKEKDERKFLLDMKDKDMQVMRLEADNAVKIADSARMTMQAQQEGIAFATSQELGNKSILQAGIYKQASGWAVNLAIAIEALMRLIRPILTALAMAAMIWVAVKAYERLFGIVITSDQAQATWTECVNAVIYIATTSYVWWFGSRDTKRSKEGK